jgi:hypothetical protein
MQPDDRPWQAWEYRLLHEGNGIEKTARLLHRTTDDVRAHETTWGDWYRRLRQDYRCTAAPENPRRLLRLAAKICCQDFPALDWTEGWQRFAYETLAVALRRFNPARGNQDTPVRQRFVTCFRIWLRQRMKKACRRRRAGRLLSPDALTRHPHPPRSDGHLTDEYDWWSWTLFQKARTRLDPRARVCLDLRLQGVGDRKIAARLGISPKTLSNCYSYRRIVELVRREVRRMVLGLPTEDLLAVVFHLLVDVGFSLGQVARLMCVEDEELRRRLGSARAGRIQGLEPEDAVRLLVGLERSA